MALGLTQTPIHWTLGSLFSKVKKQRFSPHYLVPSLTMPISIPLCVSWHVTGVTGKTNLSLLCSALYNIYPTSERHVLYIRSWKIEKKKIIESKKSERCSYFCLACIRLGLNLLVTPLYVTIRLESNDRNRFRHWLNRLVMWKYTK